MSTSKTSVINWKHGEPPIGAVYIGRGTKWGNPFILYRDGNRQAVIEKYRTWLLAQPQLLGALEELRGKTLICSCKPLACHGDVLIELLHPPKELLS